MRKYSIHIFEEKEENLYRNERKNRKTKVIFWLLNTIFQIPDKNGQYMYCLIVSTKEVRLIGSFQKWPPSDASGTLIGTGNLSAGCMQDNFTNSNAISPALDWFL